MIPDHHEALLRRRILFIVRYRAAPMQYLSHQADLIHTLFERLRGRHWTAMISQDAFDAWLLTLIDDTMWDRYSQYGSSARFGIFGKIVNVILYEALWCRELTAEVDWLRLHPWLHVPLDTHVVEHLHSLDPTLFPSSWSVTKVSAGLYMHVQRNIRTLAARLGHPSIWFEDAWSLHQ